MKVVIFLLALACAGLGYGLYRINQKAGLEREEKERTIDKVQVLSNDLARTSTSLEEQLQVNRKMDSDLATKSTQLEKVTGELESLQVELERARNQAAADAKAAEEAIAKKQAEIQELEGRNANLNNRMQDLNTAIEELERQIADTERKLAASEGDREFLLAELKRLQAEKIDLERQFNDLALLRDQIRRLKDELSIASRLEWIRKGLYGAEKPGEQLLEPGHATPAHQDSVDLNVEIRQDGAARVIEGEVPAPNP